VGDSFLYVNQNGHIYHCNNLTIYDYTDYYFNNNPTQPLLSAKKSGDELYYWFDQTNYIARYSKEINPEIKLLDTKYEIEYYNEFPADNLIEATENINSKLITETFFSDDRTLIFALFSDHIAKIYDSVTLKELNSFDAEITHFNSLKYSEVAGCYILSGMYTSYFLNEDYEIFLETERVAEEKDGKLILFNIDGKSYSVPYVEYHELIRKADEFVGDYEPSDIIREKYKIR